MSNQFIFLILVFLGAAVLAVPLAKKLGLGSILGYLIAGVVIGPFGAQFFVNVSDLMHLSEFGIVFLLFIIGLELKPARLWVMRKHVFGLGTFQVVLTTILMASVLLAFGQSILMSVVLGFGLALSSTAFALQYLGERNQLTTEHGRSAFAILLFQDVAAIPVLAALPLLFSTIHHSSEYPAWAGIIAVIAILVGGRFLTAPVFRWVASTKSREVFTAVSLLMVIGVAAMMQQVGLSMGLGSFLVGVLLSESEYRHELESDLEPFKGLLLGLFFMTIGMMINMNILIERPLLVVGVLFLYLILKFLALMVSGRLFKMSPASSRNLGFAVIQGSEFAFVIITILLQASAIEKDLGDLLIMVVSLSMAMTPLLGMFNDHVLSKKFQAPALPFDEIKDEHPEVIVAGLGRFGQIISRLLRLRDIPFTALEHDPEQVEALRRFGNKVYYGDASRIDLLEKAGAIQAKYFVLAIGDVKTSLYIAKVVREVYPHLKIFARARNRQHGFDLRDLGVEAFERDTFWSSVKLSRGLLVDWGEDPQSVTKILDIFVKHDFEMFEGQYKLRNNEKDMVNYSKQANQQLMEVMRGDRQILKDLPISQGAIEKPSAIKEEPTV